MALLSRIREVAVVRKDNRSDLVLFGGMIALSALGLLMIYSATRAVGTFSMERQMIFVAAGLIIYLLASNIDYREYRGILPLLSGVTLALLMATFLFEPVSNVNRWIPLGFFHLQPAEFAKVVVIIALASLLAPSSREEVGQRQVTWKKLGQAVAVMAVPAVLVYMQPDLGTTLVFGFILVSMLFVAGASWRQMVTLISAGVLGMVAVLRMELLTDYQMNRLRVLFDPTIEPQGIGYQLRQAQNAIGSGQLFGKGLGIDEGAVALFELVPEHENDFIFTLVGEQLGFVGGLLVLAAFALILWRLLVISTNARDRFGALIAAGVAAMVMFHVFVNIGMTVGIMPVTGLPLPFVSQGGSFYMAMTLALGITNSVWLLRTPVPGENQLT